MATRSGTLRNDTLNGTVGPDVLTGRSGGDRLTGSGGRDTILGGDGRDRIFGGNGDDVLFGHSAADGIAGSGDIVATRVASGLAQPLFATFAPGRPNDLFIVEKDGSIRILDLTNPGAGSTEFLTIPNLATEGEQGLLGLAFDPDYATNGKFYVYVTNAGGNIEVRRYQRSDSDPDAAGPAMDTLVLSIAHPDNTNHNGGWMAFGQDGYLYISSGDGGGSGDPAGNAQDKTSLLGKILRIDVSDTGTYTNPADNPFAGETPGADEIWAYGLRNAWRPSFDRATGDLYIADVGQNAREEINFQPANSNGGENYGWNIREGDIRFGEGSTAGLEGPILDYAHTNGRGSITGGYVYRGQSEGMQGLYFYADFITSEVFSLRVVNGVAVDVVNRTAQIVSAVGSVNNIASFAEDAAGNLYIIGIDGEVFRIDPGVNAGDAADLMDGGEGNERILGGAGNDTLLGGFGRDTVDGGSQNDIVTGGRGVDRLTGGAGADMFDFNSRYDSGSGANRDVITDFTNGDDRLNFATMDANAAISGNQRFSFIGDDAFTARGQIRAVQSGSSVVVSLNMQGDNRPDMQIVLLNTNLGALNAADFVL